MNIRFLSIFFLSAMLFSQISHGSSTTINLDQLKSILIVNKGKPFTINKALYKSTISDKRKDVTALLQKEASKGLLLLPKNMNAVFGDPAPGELKRLPMRFTINNILYYFRLSENWYKKSTTPLWFKTQNQYLILEPEPTTSLQQSNPAENPPSSPWPPAGAISLDQLKIINDLNQRNPFVVKQALYGELSDPNLYKDFASMFTESAQFGAFVIPQNMTAVFGDTAPGYVKKLKITYLINQKEYMLTLPEYWTRPSWITTDLNNIPPIALNIQQLKSLLIKNNKAPFQLTGIFKWQGDPTQGAIGQNYLAREETRTYFQTFADRGLFLNPYALETFQCSWIEIRFKINIQIYSITIYNPQQFPPTPEQIIVRDDFLASCKDLIIQYQ